MIFSHIYKRPLDGREGIAENYDAQEVQVTLVAFSLPPPLIIFNLLFILTIFYSDKNANRAPLLSEYLLCEAH